MAWTSDWTDADPEIRVVSTAHAEELREAINERIDIATTAGYSTAKPAFITDDGGLDLFTPLGIADQITTALAGLAAYWVDPSATIEGVAVPIPAWANVADIVTNGLGESVLTLDLMDAHSWLWWTQQKRILDQMKWSYQDGEPLEVPDTADDGLRVGVGVGYAAAVTAWNAASWGTGSPEPGHSVADVAGTVTIRRERAYIDITNWTAFLYPTISNDWEVSPSTRNPSKSWHYVARMEAATAYENVDYSAADDDGDYAIVYEQLTPNTDEDFISYDGQTVLPESDGTTKWSFGDLPTVTGTDPGSNATHGYSMLIDPEDFYILTKWDVAGGLENVA